MIDIIRELERYGAKVDVFDPWIDVREARHEYGLQPLRKLGRTRYDAAIMAVAHDEFRRMGVRSVKKLLKPASVIYDIKYVFKRGQVDGRL